MATNIKKIGTDFEREFCRILADKGYWVHFISPDKTGAQPFDIIAVKDNKPYVFDCKTCEADTFNISRLEDNQIMAFEKWLKCGNSQPMIAIKHNSEIRLLWYEDLKAVKSIKISKLMRFSVIGLRKGSE